MSPDQVRQLLAPAERPWWIAGGHAIDLFVGRETRRHADIDVLILRPHQELVHEALPGWDIRAADPPGRLRRWDAGEDLPPGVHDVWCRPSGTDAWQIQFMLDESEGTRWTSHRDSRVSRPITELGLLSADGLPFVCPEIQLFYKAADRRPRDEQDLAVAMPLMDSHQRDWLRRALEMSYVDHPWVRRRAASPQLRP